MRKKLITFLCLLLLAAFANVHTVSAYTAKQIMGKDFGLEPMTFSIFDMATQNMQNPPQKAFQLFDEMCEQLPIVLEKVKSDPKQTLLFQKQMLATSIAALFYTELVRDNAPANSDAQKLAADHLKNFVDMFGTSCVLLGAATPTKDNKLNVSGLQKEIYNPMREALIGHLKSLKK